ncbi:MAG: glycoside hydrolase family 3 N-terminal domain-containing protein, partial [bacterium]
KIVGCIEFTNDYQVEFENADYNKLIAAGGSASLNPDIKSAAPVYGAQNGLQLIDMRGLAYDDPQWDKLLDQLEVKDYNKIVPLSGYGTAYIENVGKPKVTDQDGPIGFMVAWTPSLATEIEMAQTWNDEILAKVGNLIGNAGLLNKLYGWYAPALNLHRTPFSGRNSEYYSEDSFVSGHCASVVLRSVAEKGVYTFIKHFALNNQEDHRGDRDKNGLVTWSNEQAIREIYLASFEIAIKTPFVTQYYYALDENNQYVKTEFQLPACTAVMSSFNRIGYTWAGGNYHLLTAVLKNEWGFKGFVVTDFQGGDYMEPSQMIYAGGSGVLNSVNRTGWTLNKTDNSEYYYARNAAHDILYTVANSAAMTGYMSENTLVQAFAYYEAILIAVDI